MQAAAQAIGQQLIVLDVSSDRDIETAFATSSNAGPARCSSAPAGSVLQSGSLVALAARHALPAIYTCARPSWPAA